VIKEILVLKVRKVRLGHRVRKACKVFLVKREILVHRDLRVNKDRLDLQEPMVLRAIRVILATRDLRGHKESKVFKDLRDPLDRTVILRLKERITGPPQTKHRLFRTF
jgi:hypothetical protein